MEFKGTKGWKLSDGVIYDEQYNVVADCYTTCEKDYYNALLISKSPEMLEMLNEIYKLQCDGEANDKHVRKRVLQLIKQATEL